MDPSTVRLCPLVAVQNRPVHYVASGLPPGASVRCEWLPRRDKQGRVVTHSVVDALGRLTTTVEWAQRGPVRVEIFVGDAAATEIALHTYVAPPELAGLLPLRCDFHVHTDWSDGKDSIRDMVLRGRELGLDVLAVTDHNQYESSQRAIRIAADLGLGMLCLPGEEVSASGWHLLSLGATAGIGVGGGRNTEEGLRVTIAQVHAMGGRAFLAHPYWTYRGAHHLRSALYEEALLTGELDGIELFGDVDWTDNVRSLARWSALEPSRKPPVLGNSDTHSVGHTFGRMFTLVWATRATAEDVFAAIAARRSVACVQIDQGDGPRMLAAGDFDQVDLALFLSEHYLPRHTALCRAEASAAQAVDAARTQVGVVGGEAEGEGAGPLEQEGAVAPQTEAERTAAAAALATARVAVHDWQAHARG